jgi:hypothetical protein
MINVSVGVQQGDGEDQYRLGWKNAFWVLIGGFGGDLLH